MKPSRPLALSLALNVLLAGGWVGTVFLWNGKDLAPTVAVSSPSVHRVEAKPLVVEKPWDWANVESEDYRDYIRNLRAVRCPEETIRDIVTADVAGLYRQRRQELAAGGQGGSSAEAALRGEESALLAALFGAASEGAAPLRTMSATSLSTTGAAGRPAGGRKTNTAPAEAPVMPVALREPTPAQNFNSQQLAQLQRLRDSFVAEVGGSSQDPTDPAYLRRWSEAQPRFDQQFKTLFGAKAFQEQQQAQAAASISGNGTASEASSTGESSPGSGSGSGSSNGGNRGKSSGAPISSGNLAGLPRFDRQLKTDTGYMFQ